MNLDTAAAATAAILFLVALVASFSDVSGQFVVATALGGLLAMSLALLGHLVDRRHD